MVVAGDKCCAFRGSFPLNSGVRTGNVRSLADIRVIGLNDLWVVPRVAVPWRWGPGVCLSMGRNTATGYSADCSDVAVSESDISFWSLFSLASANRRMGEGFV